MSKKEHACWIAAIVVMLIVFMVAASNNARAQEAKMLPGEDKDQMQVLFETNQQLNAGIVANAARVRAQQREIERLTGELKVAKDKCGKACEEPKK